MLLHQLYHIIELLLFPARIYFVAPSRRYRTIVESMVDIHSCTTTPVNNPDIKVSAHPRQVPHPVFKDLRVTRSDGGEWDKYRFGFGGQLKEDEIYGEGNAYDFGARMYDSRIGKFLSLDPRSKEYPFMSPYCFAANSPIMLQDGNGENPIDPRTGKPFDINLWRAAVYIMPRYFLDPQKHKVVRDEDLREKAYHKILGIFPGERETPSLSRDNVESVQHRHESNLYEHTSEGALSALKNIFPMNKHTNADYGAPNDKIWREVANYGTYVFLDDKYAESQWFFVNTNEYNIISVEENYITQVVNMTRNNDSEKHNVNSVTTFDIKKGKIQTRDDGSKYRTLSVVETTTTYKDNKPTDSVSTKSYTKTEEID